MWLLSEWSIHPCSQYPSLFRTQLIRPSASGWYYPSVPGGSGTLFHCVTLLAPNKGLKWKALGSRGILSRWALLSNIWQHHNHHPPLQRRWQPSSPFEDDPLWNTILKACRHCYEHWIYYILNILYIAYSLCSNLILENNLNFHLL